MNNNWASDILKVANIVREVKNENELGVLEGIQKALGPSKEMPTETESPFSKAIIRAVKVVSGYDDATGFMTGVVDALHGSHQATISYYKNMLSSEQTVVDKLLDFKWN